jgi:hypothetical protein
MHSASFIIQKFAFIVLELTFLFLVISGGIGLVLQVLSQERIKRWLSFRGVGGSVLGASIGAVTPFCACSTIPLTAGFLKAGIPFGSIMSFVVASPILNPYIVGMMTAFLGLRAAAIYFVIAFVSAVLMGLVLERLGLSTDVREIYTSGRFDDAGGDRTFAGKVKVALHSAWKDYVKMFPYLAIGVLIGAAIYGFAPKGFLMRVAGPENPFAVPVAALIGVPLYIRASTAFAIVTPLLDQGLGVGTAIALVVGGGGMAIPEISLLAGLFSKRVVAALVCAVFFTATVSGNVFNLIS